LIDGMPIEIVRTVGGPQAISAVVLFDVSGSMSVFDKRGNPSGLLNLDQAAKRIASAGHRDDRLRIGTIGSRIAIATTLLVDQKSASKAADEIRQRGGPSPLWDAIDRSIAVMADQPGLHAVMVHSDGQAAGNDISSEEILARALKAGVSVSAVGVADGALPRWVREGKVQVIGRNDRLLRLVRETGGSWFELKEPLEQPIEYFAWMLNRLRGSYRLDFVPPTSDGRMHEVSVTAGGQPAKTAKFIAYR
jgi:hypothetical protein